MRRGPYWPALDGLRALAVLSVMLFHAHAPALPGGFLGVDVFFVISGFLITHQLGSELLQTGHLRVGAFFWRRAARLQPALWLVLMFTAALSVAATNPFAGHPWWRDELTVLLGLANWARALNWHAPELLGHAWSLGVEEQFYLLWVFVLLGMHRLGWHVGRQALVVLCLALLSAVAMAVMHMQGTDVNRIYNGSDTRAQALLLGSALALWRLHRPAHGARWPAVWDGLALAGVVFMACWADWKAPAMYLGGFTLVAVLSVVLVAALTGGASGWLGRTLAWGPLPYIGVLSYGLYLWHYPLYRMAMHFAALWQWGQTFALLMATVLTFLLAEASRRWVETPVRHWARQKLQPCTNL